MAAAPVPVMRVSRSVLGPQESAAVMRVLDKAYLGMGAEVQAFEQELSAYLGGRPVACAANGTAALHLALQAIGIGPGDEVLVPTLTYVASFQAIGATGAQPIACDIEPENGLLDLADASRRVTPRTKAVMGVHYASSPAGIPALYEFARAHRLRVVEDAAHAFGCTLDGRRIGSFGDVVCFSFDGIKNITSGEGGAVVSDDAQAMERVRNARLLGVQGDTEKRFRGQRSWEFDVAEQGWRYHMSDIMAAIGRVQLARLEAEFKQKRVHLARRYRELLEGEPRIRFFRADLGPVVPHIAPLRVLGGARDRVRAALEQAGIQTGIHYKPNHLLARYGGGATRLAAAEQVYEEILSLPLHPLVTDEDVERICRTLRGALG
jgi:dTDP-4-amino-4,6-dideoxygalactose transaminase